MEGWKGKAKGLKGQGVKGKGNGNYSWCDKPGHYIQDCLDLKKHKEDKSAERKNNGQPPFAENTPRILFGA